MRTKFRDRFLLISAILVVLLLITNPRPKKFGDYLGYQNLPGARRVSNFFLFSVYEFGGKQYVGALGNFFFYRKLNSAQQSPFPVNF